MNLSEEICGIYKIENLVNGKVYIGQSTDIHRRWKEHLKIKEGYESIKYPLYSALRKYGVKNFEFSVVEICSKQELNEKEIYYIEKYNSVVSKMGGNGYNLTQGGQLCETYVGTSDQGVYTYQYALTGEYVAAHRNRRVAALSVNGNPTALYRNLKEGKPYKGFIWKNECYELILPYVSNNRRKVLQYDMYGNFIKIHKDCQEAANCIQSSDSLIQLCCTKAVKMAKGYVFRYYQKDFPKTIDTISLLPKTWNAVLQYDLEGNLINEFLSASIASQETGVPQGSIIACYNGAKKTAKGFIFKLKNDKKVSYKRPCRGKKIECFNDNNEIVLTFCSVTEAVRKSGYSEPTIRRHCNNGKKLDNKYWRYAKS